VRLPRCPQSAVRAAFLALGSTAVAALAAGPAAAHGTVPAEPPSINTLLFGWNFEPVIVLPLLIVAAGWWDLLLAVNRAHPDHRVPALRRWSFLAGLAAIAVALQSGIERYDTTLFSVHMVQHLILMLGAPTLLVLGAPVTQVLRAASPGIRNRWLLPILHSRAVRGLAHPAVAWIAFSAVLWGTHFSLLFDRSLEDRAVHDLEHLLYLGSGLLFWWPVVGLDPAPHRIGHPGRILYLFLQMPLNSFLAMAILFAGAPLYPHYASLGSPYGIDALADQRLAAGLMWFVGDVVFLASLLLVLAGWMRSEKRGAAAADRRDDAARAGIREREVALRKRRGDAGAAKRRADAGAAQPGTGDSSSSR